jgi:hypothetical protein
MRYGAQSGLRKPRGSVSTSHPPYRAFNHIFRSSINWLLTPRVLECVKNHVTGAFKIAVPPHTHLCLGEAEAAGELLPLCSHHIVVLLKGPLQPEEL